MKTKARLFAVWLAVFMSFVTTTVVAQAASVSATVNVTVLATTPIPTSDTSVTATNIYFGQQLKDSTISGTMKNPYNDEIVTGTFKWTSNETSRPAAGTRLYNYTFTPDASYNGNYTTATGNVNVTIEPCGVLNAEEESNEPAGAPHLNMGDVSSTKIIYGQAINYSTITGTVTNPYTGATVAGAWSWDNGSNIFPTFQDSDDTYYKIKFMPANTAEYNAFYSYCTVEVDKRTPELQSVNFSSARDAQTLSQVGITGNAIDPIEDTYISGGSFSWANPETVLSPVASLQTYSYRPANTALYYSVSRTTTYGASELLPNAISIASNIESDYAEGGTFQLDATCPGNTQIVFEIAPESADVGSITVEPSGIVHILKVGETKVKVSTNGDSTYQPYSMYTTILIKPGDPHPVITASNIKYGEAVTSSTLTTTNGTATWNTATTEYLVPGTYARPVVFVPEDNVNYRSVTVTINVTVEKANVVPTQEVFTSIQPYGTTAMYNSTDYTFESAITGAPVEGTYVFDQNKWKCLWLGSSDVLAPFTFKPTRSDLYNDGVGNVKMVGEQVTPVATVTDTITVPYGTTLGEVTIPLTVTHPDTLEDISYTYLWADGSDYVPALGTANYTIAISPEAGTFYNQIQKDISINVVQATAGITSISASDITYGQSLSDSIVTGDNKVAGEYRWDAPTTKPAVSDANTTTYTVTFYPEDTTNYKTSQHTVTLNVLKAKPKIKHNAFAKLTYGQKMSELTNTNTAHNPYTDERIMGTWEWRTPDIVPTVEPAILQEAVFHPNDTDNYTDATADDIILVQKATPNVTVTASPITYGQDLSHSTLTVNGLEGTVQWEDSSIRPTRAQSNTPVFNVVFTPTDYHNYKEITIPTAVVVNKSDVNVANISGTAITVGQTLGDSTLSWESEVEGTLTWKTPTFKPSISDSMRTNFAVIFTPNDQSNYSATELTAQVVIRKCTPTVTETTLPTVEYQTKLGDIVLNFPVTNPHDSTPIPGTWSWDDPTIIPTVATQSLGATFTPNDTDNYSVVHIQTQKVKVSKGYPIVTVTPSAIKYGQKLKDSYFSYEGTPGTATWAAPETIPNYTDSLRTQYSVTFVPNDRANMYDLVINNVMIEVLQYKPTEENTAQMEAAITVDPIPYGTKLSGTTIHGVENLPVPGTLRWANPDYKPSAADNSSMKYELIYTPNDSSNYAGGSLMVPVRVIPIDTTISNLAVDPIIFGKTLAEVPVTGDSSVDGTFTWETPDYKPTATDSKNHRKYRVVFVPTDSANYNKSYGELEVPVQQAPPTFYQDVLQSIHAADITYGQTLADSAITGNTPCDGYYEWIRPNTTPTVADSDSTLYEVRFVSTDPSFINDESLKLTIHVNPKNIDNMFDIPAGPTVDTDSDGIDDANDPDIDNDGIPNWLDPDLVWKDTDGDGIPDIYDTDLDGDGIPNDEDPDVNGVPWQNVPGFKDLPDTDGDGIPDIFDGDLDGDGISNNDDPDVNGNPWSSLPSDSVDTDGDGVPDIYDTDIDGDGIPNNEDDDYNGDGIPNTDDAASHTPPKPVAPYDTLLDTDGDGIPDIWDPDIDDDGIPNYIDTDVNGTPWSEYPPYNTLPDENEDGIPDWFQPPYGQPALKDTDGDGIPDIWDPDIDGDGIPNGDDPSPYTPGTEFVNTSNLTSTTITYGQKLQASTISGNSPIPGHYEWAMPNIVPTVADSNRTVYDVVFYPNDTVNYKPVYGLSMTVKVKPAAPTMYQDIVQTITASPIICGQTLADSAISGDTPCAGHYEWLRPNIIPLATDSDITEYGIRFVSEDPNYTNDESLTLTVHLDKYSFSITDFVTEESPNRIGSTITYTQTLDKSTIQGATPVPGRFVWEEPSIVPTVDDSENTIYYATFLPTDSNTYNPVQHIPATVKVNRADIAFTSSETSTFIASPIIYPNTLGTSTISAITQVPGHFEWQNPDQVPTVAMSLVQDFRADFYPDDPNYNIRRGIILHVEVKPAMPSIDDFGTLSAETITYGQTLSESTITGASPIEGRFEWVAPATKPQVSDSDTTEYNVKFVPKDINYDVLTGLKCKLRVNKADIDIDANTVSISTSPISYGDRLSTSIISGNLPVSGTYSWTNPEMVPRVTDSNKTLYNIKFTPDSPNYNEFTGISARVTVNKKTLSESDFSNLKASDIGFGDNLSTSTITGTAPVDGKFTWNKPTYVPIRNDSEKTLFNITFTPDDTTNYESVNLTVTVKIVDKVLQFSDEVLASIKASNLIYGQTLKESKITGKTPCDGYYEWMDNTITPAVSDSGVTKYKIRFVSKDAEFNNVENLELTVIVNKYNVTTKDIQNISATQLRVGQSLSNSVLTGSTLIPGKLSWTNPTTTPTMADSSKTRYGVTFTPDDTVNYNTVTNLNATVTVLQVIPDISTIKLKASDIAFGEALSESAISGALPKNPYTDKEIPGQYKWVNTATKPTVADSNITKYKVIFIPEDNNTYQNSSAVDLTLNIVRNNPVITANDIVATYGQRSVTFRVNTNSTGVVTYTTNDTDIITISGSTATIVGTGTATVTANVSATAALNAGSTTFKVVVNAGNTGVSGKTSYTVNYDSPPFKLDARPDTASMTLSYAVTKGNSVTVDSQGTVTPVGEGVSIISITASGAGYNAVPFNVQVTVNGKNQSLTTGGNITKVWGDAPFTLVANSSLGSNVTYRSQNTAVITISGSTATITGIGQATIVATAASNAGADETSTTFVINVVKATPKVGQPDKIEKSIDAKPFTVEDKISSSGERTYRSTDTSVATVDRYGTVTIVGEGECKIEIRSAETSTMTEGIQYTTVTVNKSAGGDQLGSDDYKPTDDDPTAPGSPDKPNPGSEDKPTGDDPFDPNKDTDGDGIPDGNDPDIDGDGIPNDEDPDIDGDGIPNEDDPDYWQWKKYKDDLTHSIGDDDNNTSGGDGDIPSRGPTTDNNNNETSSTFPVLPIAIGGGVLLVAGGIFTGVMIKKRKHK